MVTLIKLILKNMMINMMILNQKRTIAITGRDKVDKLFRKLQFTIQWIVHPLFVVKLHASNIIHILLHFQVFSSMIQI